MVRGTDVSRAGTYYAKGTRKPGTMNALEQAYSLELQYQTEAKTVLWFRFEGMKFRIGPASFYTPDFCVLRADLTLEMHEVKGHLWLQAARVKIKAAAEMYPIKFLAVTRALKRDGGGWNSEPF